MTCPDIETLISYATSLDGCDDIANHILECAECRKNFEIIHETMLADKWDNPSPLKIGKHLHTATEDMRDRFGVISIPKGAQYLKDPQTGDIESATDDSKRVFIENGMSLYVNPSDTMQSHRESMQNAQRDFGVALGMNVKALGGTVIPDCNLPWWVKFVPSPLQVNFRSCREIKVRQNDFIEHLIKNGIIPSHRNIRQEVWNDIENANLFRVYELRGWGVVFHVYSIFITHITVEKQHGILKLSIKPSNVRIYNAVMDFVKEWKARIKKPNCRCLSIGSFGGWSRNLNVVELPDSIQVLSAPNNDGSKTWSVRHNSLEHMRPIYRTLVYRLYPESWATWHDRICEVLKHDSFECSMTVARMADISKVPQDCVAEVFEDLRTKDKRWRSVKTKVTGELALIRNNGGKDAGAFVSLRNNWMWFLLDGTLLVLQGLLIRSVCKEIELWNVIGGLIVFLMFLVFLVLKNNLQRKIKE